MMNRQGFIRLSLLGAASALLPWKGFYAFGASSIQRFQIPNTIQVRHGLSEESIEEHSPVSWLQHIHREQLLENGYAEGKNDLVITELKGSGFELFVHQIGDNIFVNLNGETDRSVNNHLHRPLFQNDHVRIELVQHPSNEAKINVGREAILLPLDNSAFTSNNVVFGRGEGARIQGQTHVNIQKYQTNHFLIINKL